MLPQSYGSYGWNMTAWPGSDQYKMIEDAKDQIKLAKRGADLSDFRKAGHYNVFVIAPGMLVDAYYKGAYWLAVTSRLVGGSMGLVSAAERLVNEAPVSGAVGRDRDTNKTRAVYAQVATIIRGTLSIAQQANAQVKGVLAVLGHQSGGGIDTQTQAQHDKSLMGQAVNTFTETFTDLEKLLNALGVAFVPGYKPKYQIAPKIIWSLRAGGGVIVLGVLSPYVRMAGNVVGTVGRAVPRRDRSREEPRYNRGKKRRKTSRKRNAGALLLRDKKADDGKITAGDGMGE